jgi:small subunit ribosomal protein S16
MPVKIRLQRHGKKQRAFYHIVVADSRAPRDGKFIEKLGVYNPNTNPATIDLNIDAAVQWLHNGAQPTDTTRAILSYKGVLYKKHLEGGVKKGALTQDQADVKFAAWVDAKTNKVDSKKSSLVSSKEAANKARLATEAKQKEEKAAAIIAKNTPVVEVVEEVVEETVVAEVAVEETPVAEEALVVAEVTETPVVEAPVVEEAVVEAAPVAEETPVAEAPAAEETEAPAAE